MRIYFSVWLTVAVTLATTVSGDLSYDEDFDKFLNSLFDRDDEQQKPVESSQDLINSIKRPSDIFQYRPVAENPVNDNKNVVDGLKEFSADLFKVVANNNNENVVLSPLSASFALGMVAAGARGITKNEMINVLHLPASEQRIESGYASLINEFVNTERVTVNLLNKAFINNKFAVKEEFTNLLRDHFNATEEQFDSNDSENAARNANSWVEKNTNDKIKNLFNPGNFGRTTNMIVANVLYFKGEWENPFSTDSTFPQEFHSVKGSKQVPMMTQDGYFKFGVLPEIKARFVELPFENSEYVMIIILPDERYGLNEVEKNLETVSLQNIRNKGTNTKIELSLPRFKVESTIQLKNDLEKLGMKTAFSRAADLSGISDSINEVTDVVQNVFIDVNEQGLEATATSFAEIGFKSARWVSAVFKVDHPFHFKIIKTMGDNDATTLFVGNVKFL